MHRSASSPNSECNLHFLALSLCNRSRLCQHGTLCTRLVIGRDINVRLGHAQPFALSPPGRREKATMATPLTGNVPDVGAHEAAGDTPVVRTLTPADLGTALRRG